MTKEIEEVMKILKLLEIINLERQKKGIIPIKFSQEEIIRRYMAAMINEAANVVHEKIALRPSVM